MPKEALTTSLPGTTVGRSTVDMTWQHEREGRKARLQAGAKLANGKVVESRDTTKLLEPVVRAAAAIYEVVRPVGL